MTGTTHFVFFLLEEFSHLAFSCALEPLRIANLVSGKPLYRWSLISADGKTPHQAVITAMDAAGKLGFTHLRMTTVEAAGQP